MDIARNMVKATKVSKVIQVTKAARGKNLARNIQTILQNTPMQKANIAKATMIPRNTMEDITKATKVTKVQSLERKVTSIKAM